MTLDSATAAKLADAVYGIRADANFARGIAARGVRGLESDFDIGATIIAQGTSGAGAISQRSGFALVVPGRGARANELAVVTRGTATTYDWLSNLNVAIARGPRGHTSMPAFSGSTRASPIASSNTCAGAILRRSTASDTALAARSPIWSRRAWPAWARSSSTPLAPRAPGTAPSLAT